MIISLVLVFLLSGCNGTDHGNRSKKKTADALFAGNFCRPYTNMAETAETVYFIPGFSTDTDPMLYFLDKQSGQTGVLCNRPECLHQDKDCNAYMGFKVYGLSIYEGRIYWISTDYDSEKGKDITTVWCEKTDGTERKAVRTLPYLGESYSGVPTMNTIATFVNGNVYVCGEWADGVRDGRNILKEGIIRYSLDSDEHEMIEEQEVAENEACTVQIQPSDQYVYYGTCKHEIGENGLQPGAKLMLARYNTETEETELLYEGSQEGMFSFGEFRVNEQEILISNTLNCEVYSLSLTDGTMKLKADYSESAPKARGVTFAEGKTILNQGSAGDLIVLDMEGKEIFRHGPLAEMGTIFCGCDDWGLYFDQLDFMTFGGRFIGMPYSGEEDQTLWKIGD